MGDVIWINYPAMRKLCVLLKRVLEEGEDDGIDVAVSRYSYSYYTSDVPTILRGLKKNTNPEELAEEEEKILEFHRSRYTAQNATIVSLNNYREIRKFIAWFKVQQKIEGNGFSLRADWATGGELFNAKSIQSLLKRVNAGEDSKYLHQLEAHLTQYNLVEKTLEERRRKPLRDY